MAVTGFACRRSRRSGGAKVAERGAELRQCRGTDLRDAAHRQLEDFRDLVELELLEEVQREDGALLLLQPRDRDPEARDLRFVRQQLLDAANVRVRHRVRQRHPRFFATERLIERADRRAFGVELPLPDRAGGHAHEMRDLVVRWRAPQRGRQHLARAAEVSGASTEVARQRVLTPKLVENRAANAWHGVRAERQPALCVKGVRRLYEAHHSSAHHFVEVSGRAETATELARDMVHEADVSREKRGSRRYDHGWGSYPTSDEGSSRRSFVVSEPS